MTSAGASSKVSSGLQNNSYHILGDVRKQLRLERPTKRPTDRPNADLRCPGNCFQIPLEQQHEHVVVENSSDTSATLLHSQQELAAELYTKPLQSWQTRLVRLHDGDLADPLVMELITVNLFGSDGAVSAEMNMLVQYEALSYFWGTSGCTRRITCNGLAYGITESLESALREHRRAKPGSYLWVDALCINQYSDSEKSHQVHEMFSIYEKAISVNVWLGPSSFDSDLAVACVTKAGEHEANLRRKVHHSQACIACLKTQYMALVHLYGRPWLRRTWVRQEVYAARHITVLYGPDRIGWLDFLSGGKLMKQAEAWLTEHDALSATESHSQQTLLLLNDFEQSVIQSRPFTAKGPRDLFSVLLPSPNFEASDHRDFIYGILGIAGVPSDTADRSGREVDDRIRIDYRKTSSEV